MATAQQKRRPWQCPECGRNYRIPVEAETPALCRACAEGGLAGEHAAERSGWPARHAAPVPPASAAAGPSQAAPLTPAETRRMLEHVENISRTMTLLRRAVWVFLLVVVLNGAIFGYLLLKFQRESQGVLQLLNQPQGVDDGAGGAGGGLLDQLRQLRRELHDLEGGHR